MEKQLDQFDDFCDNLQAQQQQKERSTKGDNNKDDVKPSRTKRSTSKVRGLGETGKSSRRLGERSSKSGGREKSSRNLFDKEHSSGHRRSRSGESEASKEKGATGHPGRALSRTKSRRKVIPSADAAPTLDDALASPHASDSKKRDKGESSVAGLTAVTSSTGGGGTDGEKKKKTKLEKIEQLQAKNALYKEEFKRVQKDRKYLKKELETKKGEMEALANEMDRHVAEISRLKSQLSQALTGGGGGSVGGNPNELKRLEQENAKTVQQVKALQKTVEEHSAEVEKLYALLKQKDTEIKEMQEEAINLRKEIRETEIENKRLVSASAEAAVLVKQMTEIEEDRDRLDIELKDTVERATALVKEREDAIADLLKENEGLKNEIARRDNEKEMLLTKVHSHDSEHGGTGQGEEEDEHVTNLRMELVSISTQLEESQDRNVILEEELEGWQTRSSQMEKEVARLQDELDELQQKLAATEAELKQAEDRAERAMEAAADADDALEEAEEEFERAMLEAAVKHKAALLEAKTRYMEEAAERAAGGGHAPENDQQAMLLKEAAMKRRQARATNSGTGWFASFAVSAASTAAKDGDDTKTDLELKKENEKLNKRLDELGDLVEEQEDEIKALRSELVQVRTTMNDTLYKNKKQTERLEHENETYAARVSELEAMLAACKLQQARAGSEGNMSRGDDSSLSSHS